MHDQPGLAGAAIESLVLTGPTAWAVERHLLAAIRPDVLSAEEINYLIDLLGSTQFNQLRAAFQERAVQHARDTLDKNDAEEARVALATSLFNLGVSLREVGRHRDALAADEEALGLWRGLVTQQPARHTPDLAGSLSNLGISLQEVGRHQDALAADEEALGLRRDLATQEPARHTPDLAASLNNLAIMLCELGRHDEELERRAEAVVRWRILLQLDPDEHKDAYQRARDQLAGSFSEHGREPDAAWRAEEDVAHQLGLGIPPDRPA